MARKPTRYEAGHPKVVRCAIYTRKSTEEGLEQEFNSLDAQYEACAAYILSQRHEGWAHLPGRYDDGGFSGGNMDRPGIRRLMAEVEAGRIDVIVVYKVDRLTRSLSDFARIVDVLDAKGASFVSITQSFNTTTSMGRLTLNVLLSFAQFEREVTGERIRDKIALSKARGIWMGGTVPLGYEVRDRKLVINEAEAETVRHIFRRYVALGSGQLLIEELRRDGYRTRLRPQTGKPARGGVPFERGALFHLLANRVYLGELVHKGKHYPGEHLPILDPALWDAVQALIAENRDKPARPNRQTEPSLLMGILRDGEGRLMTPTHAVKGPRRYRYYVTHSSELVQGSPPAWRVPAHDLDTIVIERLKQMLSDRRTISRLVDVADPSAAALQLAITTGASLAAQLNGPEKRREVTTKLVKDVQITDVQVAITIAAAPLLGLLRVAVRCDPPPADIVLTAPATRRRVGKEVRLLVPSDDLEGGRDTKLLALFAEALSVRKTMLANPDRTVEQMARVMGVCRVRLGRLLRLSFVAPAVIEAAASEPTPGQVERPSTAPLSWAAQRDLCLT